MGRRKKEEVVEEVVVEEQKAVQNSDNISVNLDVDPNDPRRKEVVDGASVEPVDINVPVE